MTIEKFPVEAGQIMLFARSIGDVNPIYHDERYAKGSLCGDVIAPPTFVASGVQYDPDFPLRPKIGEPWIGSGKSPTGVVPDQEAASGRGLHAEQHYEYLRPVHPGDILHTRVIEGKSWEKESRRSGRLTFSEFSIEYYNQNDELVVIARTVRVVTEKVPE